MDPLGVIQSSGGRHVWRTDERNRFCSDPADGIHEVGIEKVLQAANAEGTEGYRIPNWMLEAMHEIGVATTLEALA